MPDVFLSYSREDQPTARRYADGLERAGFSVWWDQALHPGEAFDQVTEKALEEAKAVVVLWSKTSVNSRWVRAEATQANADSRLVPVMIEPCKRPIMFELTHTADLAQWKGSADDPAWQSFVTSLRRFAGAGATGAIPPAAAAPTVPRAGRQRTIRAAVALAVLVLLAGAAWMFLRDKELASQAGAPIRLAVLPLANLSSDPDQEYLSDGLAEDVAIQLNQIKGLSALGPASTRRFKEGNEDPRSIATQLDVAEVLTGTVRRNAQQWLFTVNLIHGEDSTSLWSGRYEGDDVFALQERIVKDVAKAVGVVLGVSDYPRIMGGTRNVDAYEQFMRARGLARKRGSAAIDPVPPLREAVRLDPGYGRAWLMLYTTLRSVIYAASPEDLTGLREQRQAAAAKLQEMSPDSLLALQYRANSMQEQHQWKAAEAAAEAALAKAPANDFESPYAAGFILACIGRISDAIPLFQRSVEAEPLHEQASAILQLALRAVGREADAQREAARATALGMVTVRTLWGSRAELLDEFAKARRPDGTLPFPLRGERPEILHDLPAARTLLRRNLESMPGPRWGTLDAMLIARAASALDDPEVAVTAVSRRIRERRETTQSALHQVWNLPAFPRSSPQFKTLVRELGLADYWRESGKWSDFCRAKGPDDFECFDKPVKQAN